MSTCRRRRQPAIRLHNYPDGWVDYFDGQKLGASDPVHRASHLTNVGFRWSRLPDIIDADRRDDREVLDSPRAGHRRRLHRSGACPRRIDGSCSFATRRAGRCAAKMLPLAQLVGRVRLRGVRGALWRMRNRADAPRPRLTDRQRDCVFWAARGKSDWEISA